MKNRVRFHPVAHHVFRGRVSGGGILFLHGGLILSRLAILEPGAPTTSRHKTPWSCGSGLLSAFRSGTPVW